MLQFATINVVSVLGNEQNVTKNVQRWPIDSSNVRQLGVNAKHHDEQHSDMALHDADVTQSLEELHEDGEDAVSLDPESFLYALEEHEFVFVDFFAGWCSHCKRCKSSPDTYVVPVEGLLDAVLSHVSSFPFLPCLFRCLLPCLFTFYIGYVLCSGTHMGKVCGSHARC